VLLIYLAKYFYDITPQHKNRQRGKQICVMACNCAERQQQQKSVFDTMLKSVILMMFKMFTDSLDKHRQMMTPLINCLLPLLHAAQLTAF